ncbi:Mg2+ transporter protein CorA-like/Zinc transport protein ZntB [Macrophomina phaseolina MS6]|uniref:Mg2+ transporter protein CorA-like/Zinc transport protein ZntB n=1 Tax=Macrophomina phaseolina (strain MS6) TaxID=1126212 RepID=K2RTT5_MACPH|nr:Mg2+ transporter protein CorA-like/Zinc transport protein ZntB [Macrophomina phaseolina MS6]
MTDTPRSEHYPTRFSTPVSELDDHRHQPESMPRIDNASPSHSRRGTVTSIASPRPARPDLLSVNDALERQGMIARDFESAIVDEDKSPSDHGDNPTLFGRRGSISPMARRDTFRRPRDVQLAKSTRSRASSKSTGSVSPPNSVDAFADPRRRDRAGTITSQRPGSEIELRLQRTVSQGTHRRRPTFSEESRHGTVKDETMSRRSSVEEDVCFPVEETSKTHKIDFEELEEFIASNQTRTPVIPLSRKQSKASMNTQRSKPKIFHDLRRKSSMQSLPKVVGDSIEHFDRPADSGTDLDEEKADVHIENPGHLTAQHEGHVNRWAFFSSEMDDTIHATDLGGLLIPGESFRDLFELPEDTGMWWLDMLNPTEEEVFAICKAFNVHPLTREDILTQEAREKVELFRSYYFVCFRSFYQMDKESEDFMEPVNVYAVVFREGLLTFTFAPNPHASNVRKRISRLKDYISLSADWVCYALIDDIVDSFGPVIRDIEHETDAIEDQVFTARAEDSRIILRAIGECRKKVMSMMRLLGGKADVIKGFAKRCNEQYSVAPRGDVGLYLSDIQDHVVTMMSNLSHFEKMLSRSHSNYLAQISVDSLSQGNAVNEMLGKITVIATILVPLNLICGLFGMNVPVPGVNSSSLGWFFGILGVMCAFVVTCLLVARKMRYV